MPYPPCQVTINTLNGYVETLAAYATDSSLRLKVLEKRRECVHFIDNLETHESYIEGFFKYLSTASAAEMNYDVRVYERFLAALPASFHSEHLLNEPLVLWKQYLQRTRDEIKKALDAKQPAMTPEQATAAKVASGVKAYLETIRILRAQEETDVRNNPDQEAEIRRRYRKAIDALADSN